MRNNVLKKIIFGLFITLILFSSFNTTFAAINESYNEGKAVIDDDLDTKVKDSVVLDALATFVYSIGSITESLVGKAFQGLTGSNYFPWADRILFNAIPMLDVNIFNPSTSSMFRDNDGAITPLASIVRNTYFTILTIAIAFLTIVVAIAGIRLAITSIASEKAKYKEIVMNWLFAIVLIFLMHNMISFVLWVNEKMVEVASSILNTSLQQGNISILNQALSIDDEKALENFLEANKSNIDADDRDFFNDDQNAQIAYVFLSSDDYANSVLFDAFGDASHVNRNFWKELFTGNGKESISALKSDIEFIKDGTANYVYSTGSDYHGNTAVSVNESGSISIQDFLNENISNKSDDEIKQTDGYRLFKYRIESFLGADDKHAEIAYYKQYRRAIQAIYSRFDGGSGGNSVDNGAPALLANLGEYFKKAAYTVPTDDDTGELTGWHRSKLTIQGALLYAIFIFQSIFYFFAYLKRFFYIIILVIMAPAIVILDFLQKSLMT